MLDRYGSLPGFFRHKAGPDRAALIPIKMVGNSVLPLVCHRLPFIGTERPGNGPLVGRNASFIDIGRTLRGFTLVELIVTLVIAGILMGLAMPSLTDFVRSNQLTTSINSFIADVQLTRSEAIKRGVGTVMCASLDGTTCTSTYAWHKGWVVFADIDDDMAWSPGTDVLIQSQESLDENIVTDSASTYRIVYTRHGLLRQPAPNNPTYAFCHLPLNQVRTVSVNPTGRAAFMETKKCF